jgi:5-methylthioadenosine/S-adenosylhomocysteine deaminase
VGLVIENVLALLPEGEKICSIYIEGEHIAAIGAAPEGFSPDTVIDGRGKLAIPGLINAHTHAYMTLFRNHADDYDFFTWLFSKIEPLENAMTEQDAYWSSVLACMEMLRSGCTCFLDMHMFPGMSIRAANLFGMRAVISRGLTSGPEDPNGQRRLSEAEKEMRDYAGCANISFMLGPHAPYSCSEPLLRRVAERAQELGIGIHTHLAESKGEIEQIKGLYGCTPAEFFDRNGILTPRTVAAHCVYLTERDMDILAERGVSVAINSASNLKLGNGIAPVPELLGRGVNLCLGTDSAASNNSLSILRELQLVTLLHKGTTGDPCIVPASQGLAMATVNGARALGLEGEVGAIAPNYRADIALFDRNAPGVTPLGDPAAALCYSSAEWQADTVITGGRVVLRNGVFTTVDTDRVRFEIQNMCKRLGMTTDE